MDAGTQKLLENLLHVVSVYGLQVIGAIVTLIIGRIAAGMFRRGATAVMHRAKVDETIISFASNLVYFAVLTFAVIAALAEFGVETTSFIAVLGAAGFAVGMALQGSLSNFAAGVLLLIFRPFKVGDFIEAGGASGTVHEIQLFATVLHTPDNVKIIVPNGAVNSGMIKNFSANDERRIEIIVGIGYNSSIPKAMEILRKILADEERVLDDPESTVAVGELADSSVNIIVRGWVKKEDFWDTKFNLTKQIKELFDQNDIEIPFPQRVVHMQAEAPAAAKAA